MKRPSPHGRSKVNVANWPLRRKLALALAVPLLLAATLGGMRVHSDLTEATNYSSSADQVTVLRPAVAYLTVAERAMVAAQAAGGKNQADLDAAVQDLKAAADQLSQVQDSAGLTPEQDHQVDVVLDLSRALREDSTETLSAGTWVAQLRQLQSGVTQLVATIVNAQIDPEPRLELLAQTLGGRFSLAMQQALVATDRSGETGSLELFSELGVEGAAIDRLAGPLGASEPAIAALRTENAQRSRTVRTGGTDLGGPGAYAEYDALITKLMDGIDTQLAGSAGDARTRASVNAGVTVAALLAALILAFLVSRLLLTPIRKVREGALSVAHVQLPEAVSRIRAGEDPGAIEPIDVTSEEEIGQMARAVDDLHQQAVLLATGEAGLRAQVGEMFVTLSRRNTTLINQQLGLIEALEKDEEDPRRLESLFRLDHLASRMRRTSDSLLILADAPAATAATAGQGDLTVADSLQAATAGVQDYQRVRVGATSSASISDAAAADVVHLLTELVDNALSYSSPACPVMLASITGRYGVTVEVRDEGLGIPAPALAVMNETLRSGGDVTPDTARRMGLFVVSRLAQRHGISVVLRRNDKGGTTATVFLPVSILPSMAVPGSPATAPAAGPVAVPDLDAARTPETISATRTPEPEATDSIEDRINGALGLPRRRPGTSYPQPGTPAPLSKPTPAPAVAPAVVATSAPAPVTAAPAAEIAPAAVAPVPSQAPIQAPADVAAASTALVAPLASGGPAVEAPVQVPIEEPEAHAEVIPLRAVPEPVAAEPSPASTSPASAGDALDGATEIEDWGEDFDAPIFKAMQSAWLSSSGSEQPWSNSEVEAGWDRADEVAETPSEPQVTATGLPVRRPGTLLVPGGVTKPSTVAARDPEAIRKRLAAHAQGVSRGRSAATNSPHPQHTEAGPA